LASHATIYKASIHVADIDRQYYGDHALTLARHPSETDERMMVRLVAFILHAHDALSFGRGLSAEEEPALWHKDLTGEEKTIRRACGRAKQVCVYTYGGRGADQWWANNLTALDRLNNLSVMNLPLDGSRALTTLTRPSMQLQCTVQEGQIWMTDGEHTAHIELTMLKGASTPFRQ
jgi:uncharacterized protein YaeQ